ncbi:MAG TPA: hypothetical protein VLB80_04490 [Candidatus Babeliales bacterium]|nr:hypothetical protein [Candidatus Babeliales bacterium]
MKNTTLIIALIAITTASAISAHYRECYTDEAGYRRCDRRYRPVRDTVEGAGDVAANILTLGGHSRRKAEEQQEREEMRQNRRGVQPKKYRDDYADDENTYDPYDRSNEDNLQ